MQNTNYLCGKCVYANTETHYQTGTTLNTMKKLYHIDITSHSEVIARQEADFGFILNAIAATAFACNAELLADAEMSTHIHLVGFFENPMKFCMQLKIRLTKEFNFRYLRSGAMWDRGFFCIELEGINHITTAISYVLRNGLHHGQASCAFGYKYCAVNEFFAKDRGLTPAKPSITSRNEIALHLPQHTEFPDEYAMDSNGVFLRSTFMDLQKVEILYRTPRSYITNLNRLTSEEWLKEQDKDSESLGYEAPRIDLTRIERRIDTKGMETLLKNERGYTFYDHPVSDIDVCKIIDNDYVPTMKVNRKRAQSIYQLSESQRLLIAEEICHIYHIPASQIRRTVILPKWDLNPTHSARGFR